MTKNLNKKSKLFMDKVDELKNISGFLNVHKSKTNNIKGFKWIYTYEDNGENKSISNMYLLVLKHIVNSKNLPWKVINQSQAAKSIKLEKSTYDLLDNEFGILFLDIVDDLFNPFNGFWHYKYNKQEFFDINLEELRKIVEENNLPWIIVNEDNALNSFNLDLSLNFQSGVYMVNKINHTTFNGLFQWCYIYKDDLKNYQFIICDDLNSLKDIVCKKGLKWEIKDMSEFNKSIAENNCNLININQRKWAFTGINKVKKRKMEEISQGFLWVYRFKKNGSLIELSSTSLSELKQKIIKAGFDWIIEDEKIAMDCLIEDYENFEKYGFSVNKNKTGIYRVFKNKNKRSKQGFYWCYSYSIDNKRTYIQSVNLLRLKEKVLKKGLEWKVIDLKLKEKSFKENKKNMKRYYDNKF